MELEQVYRYIDPYSLLVNDAEMLVRVHCPFKVELIHPFAPLSEDDTLMVTKVMLDKDNC